MNGIFFSGILENARASDLVWCDVEHIDENDPHSISAFLATLDASETTGVAIMAPESPQVRDAIYRLQKRGVAAQLFIADQSTMEEQLDGHQSSGCGRDCGDAVVIRN